MKIVCDCCGALIETERDNRCPSCGALYGEDKEIQREIDRDNNLKDIFLEQQKEDLEFKRVSNEKQRRLMKNQENGYKSLNIFFTILTLPIIGFIGFIILIIILSFFVAINYDTISNIVSQENDVNYDSEYKIEINDNPILGVDYNINIEDVVILDASDDILFGQESENYVYVGIHLISENLTDIDIKLDKEYYMYADDILQTSVTKQLHDYRKYISHTIPRLSKTDGWLAYQIPVDAEKIVFVFDNKSIIIPNDFLKN